MPTVMIISGESSGELYGSLLAKALKNRLPDIHIIGIGGERMEEAGVELVSHIASAFGLIEAVSALNKIKTAFNNAVGALKKFKPEVLVLIDYPDLNLRVAKAAKSLGIKILYYVSPQVWAWRKGRVTTPPGLSAGPPPAGGHAPGGAHEAPERRPLVAGCPEGSELTRGVLRKPLFPSGRRSASVDRGELTV